jgi:hypothetical protein
MFIFVVSMKREDVLLLRDVFLEPMKRLRIIITITRNTLFLEGADIGYFFSLLFFVLYFFRPLLIYYLIYSFNKNKHVVAVVEI